MRNRFVGSLAALVFAVPLSVAIASPAHAADEKYTWKTADRNIITVSGGNLGSSTIDLTKTKEDSKSVVFSGNATYQCKNSPVSGDIIVTIPAGDYKVSDPTAGTLSGPDANCGFDIPIISSNSSTAPGNDAQPACDQGSFTWMFCPMIDNVSSSLSKLARDALVPMLKVNQVTPQTTPDLYKIWQIVRDVTSVLMILMFMLIIVATAMGQDIPFFSGYTIRKTWPKLIMSAIFIQFSFLFSGLFVDLGNVLGGGISNIIDSVLPVKNGQPSYINLLSNMATLIAGLTVAGVAGKLVFLTSWTIALPIIISLLLTLLVVFLTLAARFVIIAALVVLSPVAFLAWVLPGTNKYFELWWKTFFRLILMYPIVIGILSIAGIVSQLLGSDPSGDTTGSVIAELSVKLLKPLAVIAAFAMVPLSIKASGSIMGKVHGMISGQAGKAQKALKGSDFYKEGKEMRRGIAASRMKGLAGSAAITSLTGSHNPLKKAAGRGFMGATALTLAAAGGGSAMLSTGAVNKAYRKSYKSASKYFETLDTYAPNVWSNAILAATGDKKARAKTLAEAPELLEYTHASGVMAMAKMAGASFGTEQANAVRSYFGNQIGASIIGASAKDTFSAKPHYYLSGNALAGFMGKMDMEKLGKLDSSFYEDATGVKETAADGRVTWKRTSSSIEQTRAIADGLSADDNAALMSGYYKASRTKRAAALRWAASNSDILAASEGGRAHLDAMANQMFAPESRELFGTIYKEVLGQPLPADVNAQRAGILAALGRPGWRPQNQIQVLAPGQTQQIR